MSIPPLAEFVWESFWRLEQSRQVTSQVQAFTYREILAWKELADASLSPWEVEALMAMDVARRNTMNLKDAETETATPSGLAFRVPFDSPAAMTMFDRMAASNGRRIRDEPAPTPES